MKKLILFVLMFPVAALAQEDKYKSYCIEGLSAVSPIKEPMVFPDTASNIVKITWDGDAIYREGDFPGGRNKREMWSLKRFKETGEGKNKNATSLQVINAQRYIIMKQLHDVANETVTTKNAKAIDKALESCEGVKDTVAVDGDIKSKGTWSVVGDIARKKRQEIRDKFPDLFKSGAATGGAGTQ